METDDLLSQIFAAPIYLPPVKFLSSVHCTTKDDRFLLLTNDHLFQTSAEENHAMDSNVSHLQQHQNGNNAKQNLKKSGESVTIKQELESIEVLNERKFKKHQESQTEKPNDMIRKEKSYPNLSSTKKDTRMEENEFMKKQQIHDGTNELQIPKADNEKFNSIRVVRNVRQYVKLWTKSNGSDGTKMFLKHNLLTVKKTNETEKSEKTNIENQHSIMEQQNEIIAGYVTASQRRQNFEVNQKFKHDKFAKIVSANHAKRIAMSDEEISKVQETSDMKINVTKMYHEDDKIMLEAKESGSIEQLKLFFEKKSEVNKR